MDLLTVFSSGILAALIAALVSLRNNERKLSLQYITGERAKWRNTIREKALAVFDAASTKNHETIGRCHFEFSHLLHLGDSPDDEILENLKTLASQSDNAEVLDDFRVRISLLLKYEWDKAKLEARPSAPIERARKMLAKALPKWFEPEAVKRTTLREFKNLKQ